MRTITIGYAGIGVYNGRFVEKEDAFAYAAEQCGIQIREDKPLDPEFAEMLEDWYFSGSWVFEEIDNTEPEIPEGESWFNSHEY